jgi:hypothetical protein
MADKAAASIEFALEDENIGGLLESDPETEEYLRRLAGEDAEAAAASGMEESSNGPVNRMTGRFPQILYITCDSRDLSQYQQLLRKQIEFFEAGPAEVNAAAQGRNKPIVLGQVGIRCRHCAVVPPGARTRGAVYFPSKLEGIYQMAQNMASSHMGDQCKSIGHEIRAELLRLRGVHASTSGTGKASWAERAQVLGVFEDAFGLRYTESLFDALSLHPPRKSDGGATS